MSSGIGGIPKKLIENANNVKALNFQRSLIEVYNMVYNICTSTML